MTEEEKRHLNDALHALHHVASIDHWCDNKTCSIDTPKCDTMHARATRRSIEACLDPVVRSMHPERLQQGRAERVYFERWQKENERKTWLNSGFTALEWILCKNNTIDPETNKPVEHTPERPSQRDMDVATAVIQWLGTNCGHGLILQCERLIEQDRLDRNDLAYHLVQIVPRERDLFDRMCDKILRDLVPSPKTSKYYTLGQASIAYLRMEIRDVFRTMFCLFAYEMGVIPMAEAAKEAGFEPKRFEKLYDLAVQCVVSRIGKQKRPSKTPETTTCPT